MKIAMLVPSLVRGGAERQLVMVARGLHAAGVEVTVMVFYPGGAFERDLLDVGIRLISLDKRHRWDLLGFSARFAMAIHEEKPDLLYSFMASSNLFGAAVAPLFPALRLVWGIRSARQSLAGYDWMTRLVARLETAFSGQCDLVIVNSKAGQAYLHQRRFPANKIAYVPNGIDVERYRPNPAGRQALRAAWAVDDDQFLIGIVARADPVKGHEVFLAAAQELAKTDERLRFVCVGLNQMTAARLTAQAHERGLASRLFAEGPRDDLSAVYSALDVCVMCSHSEGFPNVVAEAMACGVPCAVTNVGDAREIVGDTGTVVPPADPPALAAAIRTLLDRVRRERPELARLSRNRIISEFSLQALTNRTLAQLHGVLGTSLAK